MQDVLRGSSSSNTSSSSSTTVTDRFFRSSFGEVTQGRDSEPFRPACRSHTELIPRMARARNSRAKWKYLVQAERDEVQHFQVNTCTRRKKKNPTKNAPLIKFNLSAEKSASSLWEQNSGLIK